MPPLVGGIDASKTGSERKLRKGGRSLFLPGGAVDEIGNSCRLVCLHWIDLRTLLAVFDQNHFCVSDLTDSRRVPFVVPGAFLQRSGFHEVNTILERSRRSRDLFAV